ncbi:MAG: CDP-alcohol phosphatidyltransferase family protein [Candidatus Methylomirabilales bacterium]
MVFNLPNGLTFLRLILAPLIVVLLVNDAYTSALIVFLLAGITDGLDGYFARSLRERTEFGRVLDPIADKILLGSALFTLAFLGRLPMWLIVIAVGRDLILVLGSCLLYTVSGRLGYPPSAMGKLATLLQIFTVVAVMMVGEGDLLLVFLVWGTAAVTILSGLDYTYRGAVELIFGSRNASPA